MSRLPVWAWRGFKVKVSVPVEENKSTRKFGYGPYCSCPKDDKFENLKELTQTGKKLERSKINTKIP